MKSNRDDEAIKSGAFVKLMRSPESQEVLHSDPLAFALLTVIALRARRRAFDVRGLKVGEALVGDYAKIGFARRQYRTRIARLVRWGLITTRATRKGTIAALTSPAVFDINAHNEGLTSAESKEKRPATLPMNNCAERPTDGQLMTNRRPLTNNDKKAKKRKNDSGTAVTSSVSEISSSAESGESFFVGGYQNQNQPVQSDVKWPEYASWCRSQGGQPTEKGFRTWLGKQKPQWRNKVKTPFDETGYVLDGKFLTDSEAIEMGRKNPKLLTEFRKATKSGDKIHVVDSPSGFTQNLR